jgi:hypothetical protein
MLTNIIEWLKGKKAYIVAIITAVCAGLTAIGVVIPEWVYMLLAAAGIGAVRAAIK